MAGPVRSMAHERGQYGQHGDGVEGKGCATAGSAFVGLCCVINCAYIGPGSNDD